MEKQVFTFGLDISKPLLIAILVGIPLIVAILYSFVVIKVAKRDKIILTIIRVVILLLLFACIMNPVMRGKKKNESYLAVLLDTSKSMTLDDTEGGKQRFEVAKKFLTSSDFINELRKTFKENTLKIYTFADDAKPFSTIEELKANGEKTDLVKSINTVVDQLQGVPLSGILAITDGADNANDQNALIQLGYSMREKNIPLYFIGIGSEVKLKDIEVKEVTGPEVLEEKMAVNLNITLSSQGYSAKVVPLSIYEDDKLIKKFDQHLPANSTIAVKFTHNPTGTGFRKYRAEIPIDNDEFVKDNNSAFFTVNIIKKKEKLKVLFVQGYIGEEFKQISRTLHVDPDLELISISHTGPGVYYVIGAKDEREAAALQTGGFPKDKETIYKYDVIVFDNLLSDALNKEQIDGVVDFVFTHGGGFLAMGSGDSFKPVWNSTRMKDVLPVILENDVSQFRSFSNLAEGSSYEFKLKLTSDGMGHEIFEMDGDIRKDKEKWESLPTLVGYAPVVRAKPGAMVLAVHESDKNQYGPRIILAIQNYGAGKTAALTVGSLNRWRLRTESTNKSYEKFWRQLIHWLSTERLEKISLRIDKNWYSMRETMKIEAAIFERILQSKDTRVEAQIVDPYGKKANIKLDYSLSGNWQFEGKYIPQIKGNYRIKVVAKNSQKTLESKEISFDVRETSLEFSNVTLNETGLIGLASASNGKYYKPKEVTSKITKDLTSSQIIFISYDKDLWDMPWFFGLIVLLFTVEWIFRKTRGLI